MSIHRIGLAIALAAAVSVGPVRAEDQLNIDAGPYRLVYIPFAGVITVTHEGRPFLDGCKFVCIPGPGRTSDLSGEAKASVSSAGTTHTVNLMIRSLDDEAFPMQLALTEEPTSLRAGTASPDAREIRFEGSLTAGPDAWVVRSTGEKDKSSVVLYDPAKGGRLFDITGAPSSLQRVHGTWDFSTTASPQGVTITTTKAGAPAVEGIPGFATPRPGVATGAAPEPAALEALQKAGYTTVVDLRPDGDAGAAAEEAVVGKLGMKHVRIPVTLDALSADVAKHLQEVLDGKGPILVHDAGEGAVGALLAMHAVRVETRTVDEALKIAKTAGLTDPEKVEKVKAVLEKK